MNVPEGRPILARRFNGGLRSLKPIESRRDERKHSFVIAISAAPSGLSRFVFTHPGIPELANLQEVRGEAKPYQVRQFMKLVERYNLQLEDDA